MNIILIDSSLPHYIFKHISMKKIKNSLRSSSNFLTKRASTASLLQHMSHLWRPCNCSNQPSSECYCWRVRRRRNEIFRHNFCFWLEFLTTSSSYICVCPTVTVLGRSGSTCRCSLNINMNMQRTNTNTKKTANTNTLVLELELLQQQQLTCSKLFDVCVDSTNA
jgi:hypothetical protein